MLVSLSSAEIHLCQPSIAHSAHLPRPMNKESASGSPQTAPLSRHTIYPVHPEQVRWNKPVKAVTVMFWSPPGSQSLITWDGAQPFSICRCVSASCRDVISTLMSWLTPFFFFSSREVVSGTAYLELAPASRKSKQRYGALGWAGGCVCEDSADKTCCCCWQQSVVPV